MTDPCPLPTSTPPPLGFSSIEGRAYFGLYSSQATKVFLGLFSHPQKSPDWEFPMEKTGDIWHICIQNLPEKTLYAYRIEGPYEPEKGLLYKKDVWLVDPYAKLLESSNEWGKKEEQIFAKAATPPPFDWEGVSSPRIPKEDLIIYEMHIRGFTQDPSSHVAHPGTFLGVIEKIPYLKKLGINAVELMPIFEFDEVHSKEIQPHTGEPLLNYWGYNSLFFFAPMRRYALLDPVLEFKQMVKALHKEGIEVILDVVYNHTGEGNEKEYYVHFRGIDNPTYYMTGNNGEYLDFTGCGNTVQANHPVVQEWILSSLRYWVEEMKVDGFRFDLASIFTRGAGGAVLEKPPLLEALSQWTDVKLIAEPWDAAGLYQVGYFPKWGPWSDWNGAYRDVIRRFIKGSDGYAGRFADALSGSSSIFHEAHTPLAGINFITAHDGYTLRDLVTYQMKHNYDNGEMNQDGNNQNDNWNCGAEGPTQNKEIFDLREKQMRNFLIALFFSQGIPMFLMGDEYGNTRKGNNNPYGQDNDINWFQWNFLEHNEKILSFVSSLIAFRKNNPVLKKRKFLSSDEIDWHGVMPYHPDWGNASRFVAYELKGKTPIYVAFNASFYPLSVELPAKPWEEVVFTPKDWSEHCFDRKGEILPASVQMPPYSALVAKIS